MTAKPGHLILLAWVGLSLSVVPVPGADPPVTTPLETYLCYVHDTISPRWYDEMAKNNTGGLRYGTVKVRFTLHSDGSVSNLMVLVGDSSGLLKTVTMNVIRDSAPFKPFGPDLIKEMGNSCIDDCTFEVTRKRNGMTPAEAEHRVPAPPPD